MKLYDLIEKQIKGSWGNDASDTQPNTPVIKTNNMTYEGSIVYDNIPMRFIQEKKLPELYLKTGDILVEKSGGTKTHSVGYACYFDGESDKYICNNFILGLRVNTDVANPRYCFYQIKYKYENGLFSDCYNKTTGIQNLKVDSYLGKDIRYHLLDEQKTIVHELDAILKCIDIKKDTLNSLDNLVKSRFIEMFGNPLDNDKGYPTEALSVACPFNSYKGGVENIDGKYWLLNLDVIESHTGRIISKQFVEESAIGNSTIVFDSECVLYSKLRPYLNKVVIPDQTGYATSELVYMKTGKKINKYFLSELLRSKPFVDYIDSKSSGAKMPRASMEFLRKFPLMIPEYESQKAFESFVRKIDKSKFIVQKQIEDLQELLDSKMDKYFG